MISTALRMENPVKSPMVPPINPRAASVVTLVEVEDKYQAGTMMKIDPMVPPIQDPPNYDWSPSHLFQSRQK